jgi:hypothetical protein
VSDYPEHDKLAEISEQSQTIGEFLDTCGFILCASRDAGDNGEPRFRWIEEPICQRGIDRKAAGEEPDGLDFANKDALANYDREEWPAGYYPVGNITTILADYFGIDLDAIDREKRQMLDDIRAKAAA